MKKIEQIIGITGVALFSLGFFHTAAYAQKSSKLSDPEVASVAVVANQIDIDYANIAKEKSKDAEVIKFAEMMAKDHKTVIDKAVALVTKLKVTPKENATGRKLLADAEKTKTMLRSKSGSAFDKAYIDNEVTYHKAVIAAVNDLLIPESENAELKKLLQDVVPIFKAHLHHAEMVQKEFKSK
jgi:putative membrane protein